MVLCGQIKDQTEKFGLLEIILFPLATGHNALKMFVYFGRQRLICSYFLYFYIQMPIKQKSTGDLFIAHK